MKFKKGDIVKVVSYSGSSSLKDYGITKIGTIVVVENFGEKYTDVISSEDKRWPLYTRDLELLEVCKSPLWKALA